GRARRHSFPTRRSSDLLGASLAAGFEDFVGAEVGFGGRSGAEEDGFVGLSYVKGVRIGLGIDGDGLDAHLAKGADDAAGDFAARSEEHTSELQSRSDLV